MTDDKAHDTQNNKDWASNQPTAIMQLLSNINCHNRETQLSLLRQEASTEKTSGTRASMNSHDLSAPSVIQLVATQSYFRARWAHNTT